MTRNSIVFLAAASLLLSSAGLALADGSDDLATVLTSGKTGVNVRTRYEHVDQDNFVAEANALTTRLRLNYRTGQWNGWTGFVEYDYLFHLLNDFNSGAGTNPDKGQFPVVADPNGADLNQLYLDYNFSEDQTLRVGRQRISHDNERFVGGVGWRQNEQTFDRLTYTTTAIANTELSYSYVGNVRRIFGERVAAGRHNVDTHLLHAKVAIDQWNLTGVYHDFSSETGSVDYGTEFDVSAGRKLTGNYGILFKGAFFSGDDAAYPDTNKFWIMFTANY